MGFGTPQTIRIGKQILEFSNRRVRRFAQRIHKTLTGPPEQGGTPVDTGHARDNWQVGLGRRPQGEIEGGSSGEYAKIGTYKIKRGQGLFIVNNVPYVALLNNGSSAQAPSGFVQAAIAKANKGR